MTGVPEVPLQALFQSATLEGGCGSGVFFGCHNDLGVLLAFSGQGPGMLSVL